MYHDARLIECKKQAILFIGFRRRVNRVNSIGNYMHHILQHLKILHFADTWYICASFCSCSRNLSFVYRTLASSYYNGH